MLGSLLALQLIVVGTLVVLASALCDVEPFRLTPGGILRRVYGISPYVGFLALVYVFNQGSHTVGQRIAETVGRDITVELYAIEGDLVLDVQRVIPETFVEYFTFVYIYGFAFLLVFPIVAYFALPRRRHLEELFVAYAVNYGVGALCYVFFIAYGPRNVIANVSQPMHDQFPELLTLTGSVNSATNVFPSLHVSLAVTVALMALRTRDAYPRWLWLASFVAVNVAVSTTYLGIHWVIDVIAGVALAVVSVLVAQYVVTLTNAIRSRSRLGVETDRT